MAATTVAQAQTPAGTAITNVADVRYSVSDAGAATRSNADVIVIAERLDLTLSDVSTTGVRAVSVQNTGNGVERFTVTAVDGDRTARTLAMDSDDDGLYDPAKDALLDADRTPPVAPGARVRLFIVGGGAGAVTITATAATGSGAPGTTFAGQGDGGGDAVVGATGARAILTLPSAATIAASPVLTKSQSVVSPDGGVSAVRGATVTYALDARFAQATQAARVDDVVPTGARYVAGSLRLDGAVLSDAADGDAGGFDGGAVHVALGDVPAGADHIITFQASLE